MMIRVNGREVEAAREETILTVLRREGISIPTLCYMEGLPPTGACRMCVVELAGQGRLVPACSQPVAEGMEVLTHSPMALEARRTIVELLLAEHPDDCLYCVRNGRCQLQDLAEELGVRRRTYAGSRSEHALDTSSPSIVRDPSKCILCGKCVRVCEEVQGVAAIDFAGRGSGAEVGCAFEEGLNVSSCVNCGQCVMVCPTGALAERQHIRQVLDAINDPGRTVVVQHAPSVSVTLAEEFGMRSGQDVAGKMTAALRRMGFDHVFDTAFGADLTVMEEAHELVERVRGGGPLPLLTSCSPGWVKFLEELYPDLLENISSCKSPQQMLGAVIRACWAPREEIDPADVYSVSVMPCTAKKFEAGRPEMVRKGLPDVDAVLTTRELAEMIRMFGLDLAGQEPEGADTPFGVRSSAGKIFGASGGVMEAAVRTAYHMITGGELESLEVEEVRGTEGLKEATIEVDGMQLGVAVVSGLGNARKLLDQIRAGREDIHFVEIMTCPGGCIAGGGQPFTTDLEAVRSRMEALYRIDSGEELRTAHGNPAVRSLYEDCLGEPGGAEAHRLLHTSYTRREVLV
jgi:NADH-quinone oxidoreductase subunit G/NADP-reducing hydrogenase subunit HndD